MQIDSKAALGRFQRYAKIASKNEVDVLDSLANYYRGECSLGHVAETVNMPLRAVMEFMQRHRLPYYSDAGDTEEGLRRISEIRQTV